MIAHVYARPADQSAGTVRVLSPAELRVHPPLPDAYALLWVDVRDPQSDDIDCLRQTFQFHPVALEDVARGHQRAKIDEYRGYAFGVLYAARAETARSRQRRISVHELQFFWGSTFLVTVHHGPFPEIEDMAERIGSGSLVPVLQAENRPLSAADLAYRLIDAVIDSYFPAVDLLAEWSAEIEEDIFSPRRGRGTLEAIFALKKQVFEARKVLGPSRDAINVLLRRDQTLFGDEFYPYFQDVYDHAVRAIDTLDTYRDLLSSALDTYLSFVSNDVNQTVKKMTAVTAILMVDALIAGIYGMNFAVMPELQWAYGYPYALGLMLVTSVLLGLVLKRIRWL